MKPLVFTGARLMKLRRHPIAHRLVYGAAAILIATGVKFLLRVSFNVSGAFALYSLAVVASALVGGFTVGAMVCIATAFIGKLVFEPAHAIEFKDQAAFVQWLLYVGQGLIMAAIVESLHRAHALAESAHDAKERAQAETLKLLDSERSARSEAETASRLKDEFLATMSHELRTPLNAILGWSATMRAKQLDATMLGRAAASIERNVHTLARLVDDVLDVSRIVRGNLQLRLQTVKLDAPIQEAVATVRHAADAKEIQLECHIEGLPEIVGDPDRLKQIAWNLVSNAVKFSGRGGVVTVRGEHVDGRAVLSVSDSGEGIPPTFLPFVFDRFRQADGSSTRTHGGLGLGLAIVRHLVELHGGTVRAASPGPGQGATFTVELPARAVSESREAPDRSGEVQSLRPNDGGLVGLNVLVVDDDADARELISTILRAAGAEVQVGASSEEALSALAAAKPDVIISDVGMPGEDGLSLMRRIRKLPRERGGATPAAALTAYARPEDVESARAAGFDRHLSKPVHPARLVAVVAALGGRDVVRV